jgi:UDP-N-acetylglucosamine 2-epimerase (hydrolysing)
MAPVYLALKEEPELDVCLITTAQHRQMLDQVLSIFGMKPDYDLNAMRPDQQLSDISSRILTGVQKILLETKPDAVLVHGDTATCLFAAIAAFYERIPVGHVEAGLRTYNIDSPWPEEMNRRLVDPICKWCFAPTQKAKENLISERIPQQRILITGNTIVDALLYAKTKVQQSKTSVSQLPETILDGRRLILVTGHRRESFGEPFKEFCMALRDIVNIHKDTVLVYPVHLNPNVQSVVHELLDNHERIILIPPVHYLEFIYLMDKSFLIITDSGGIQEEAPTFNKPVLVARETTERPEAIESGMAKLVGTSRDKIVTQADQLLCDASAYSRIAQGSNPYGDGRASIRIRDWLLEKI